MFTVALFTVAKGGNKPDVYQQMNGKTKCGLSMKWNII